MEAVEAVDGHGGSSGSRESGGCKQWMEAVEAVDGSGGQQVWPTGYWQIIALILRLGNCCDSGK